MQVERFYATDQVCTFVVRGIPLALANGLRRNCRAQVPTMAIEWVCIKNNTSGEYNEVIAQRLGLIPLDSRAVEDYAYEAQCPCAGTHCKACTSQLFLQVSSTATPLDVLTHLFETETPTSVYPVVNMPLLTLQGHETLTLRALATKGVGKTHSKWDPCSEVLMMEVTDDTFSFRVESCGQHTAATIVLMALAALQTSFETYLHTPVPAIT